LQTEALQTIVTESNKESRKKNSKRTFLLSRVVDVYGFVLCYYFILLKNF